MLNLSNGPLQVQGNEIIGVAGTGTFTQSGGTNTVSAMATMILGDNPSGSGTYNLSAGYLANAADLTVGLSGTGVFTQSGGTNSVLNGVTLGSNSNSLGTYNYKRRRS